MRTELRAEEDELARALAEFSRAALRLSLALDSTTRDTSEGYPFAEPFDDVAAQIMTWADIHAEAGCR